MRVIQIMAAGLIIFVTPAASYSQQAPIPVAVRSLRADTAQGTAMISKSAYEASTHSLRSSSLKGTWVGALTGAAVGFVGTIALVSGGCDASRPLNPDGTPMGGHGCSAAGGRRPVA